MYYPLLITADKEVMAMTNEGYFFFSGQRGIIPAKSGEIVYISDFQGLKGAGLTYARVNKPTSLQEGYSDDGFHYILGPGETESLNVTTTKKLVIFDGVYGNGYPQQLDFSAEGFGKINGYYGEIVPCGGSVTLPPDPTEENAVFLGWTSWDSSSYGDLAYLNVPAGSENVIGFRQTSSTTTRRLNTPFASLQRTELCSIRRWLQKARMPHLQPLLKLTDGTLPVGTSRTRPSLKTWILQPFMAKTSKYGR